MAKRPDQFTWTRIVIRLTQSVLLRTGEAVASNFKEIPAANCDTTIAIQICSSKARRRGQVLRAKLRNTPSGEKTNCSGVHTEANSLLFTCSAHTVCPALSGSTDTLKWTALCFVASSEHNRSVT